MKLLEHLLSSPALESAEDGITNFSRNIVTSVTSVTANPTPERQKQSNSRSESLGPQQASVDCWHCHGLKTCGCISCAERLQPGAVGECII
jgi:hypothetical protein